MTAEHLVGRYNFNRKLCEFKNLVVQELCFMSYRQFVWGLSVGVNVCAIAGTFWLGLAAWSAGLPFFLVSTIFIVAAAGAIFVAAARLRRKATGFSYSELKDADESQRRQTRKIVLGFRWISIVQTCLIWFSGLVCFYFQRLDLVLPLIGLIVTLHFLPLARLFQVHLYYATGIVGSVVSLIAVWGFQGTERLMFLGLGIGLDFWLSAIYLIGNADQIANHIIVERQS